MFGALKLWSLRRKLKGSLATDPLQVGWATWLDGATSVANLRETCTQPGWVVHLAYWERQPQNTMLEAALVMAQLAIEHGPPNVFPRSTVQDLRQLPFPEIADTIVAIEKKFPAMRSIEATLPAVSGVPLAHLERARGEANLKVPENADLAKAGVAGAAAAGFSLALQAIFHRHYGRREAMTIVTAGAASMFYIALPDNRADLMAQLRDRFQW